MVNYYIEVNSNRYPCEPPEGRMANNDWDGRESKTFRLSLTYQEALQIFSDGTEWNIVCVTNNEETGEILTEIYDNSDFNIAGDITDHRDGTVSITMGKPTNLEEAYELLYGGEL